MLAHLELRPPAAARYARARSSVVGNADNARHASVSTGQYGPRRRLARPTVTREDVGDMPNLLPDWLPWIHPAGRLIWASLHHVRRDRVRRRADQAAEADSGRSRRGSASRSSSSSRSSATSSPSCIPDDANLVDWKLDAIIVDLVLLVLVAHAMLMVAEPQAARPRTRRRRGPSASPARSASFALMALAYARRPPRVADVRERRTCGGATRRSSSSAAPTGHAVDLPVALAVRLQLSRRCATSSSRDLRRASSAST